MVVLLPFSIYICSTRERTLTSKLKAAEKVSQNQIKKQGATLGIPSSLPTGVWPASPHSWLECKARAVYPTLSGAL